MFVIPMTLLHFSISFDVLELWYQTVEERGQMGYCEPQIMECLRYYCRMVASQGREKRENAADRALHMFGPCGREKMRKSGGQELEDDTIRSKNIVLESRSTTQLCSDCLKQTLIFSEFFFSMIVVGNPNT